MRLCCRECIEEGIGMDVQQLKIGVRLLDDLGQPADLLAQCVLADELGFDSVWFPNSPFRTNAWVLNSAAAISTNQIELRPGAGMYAHDPSEVATYVATLDWLSNGRTSLAVGIHNHDVATWIGQNTDDVVERTRDTMDIVRRLLHGERGPFESHIFRFSEKAYLRSPVLRPDLPIILSTVGDELLELSGEIADGSAPMVTPPESASLIIGPIHRGLQRSSRPERPFDACAFVWLVIAEERTEAARLLADVVAYYGTYLDPRALALLGLTVEDMMPAYNRVVAGDRAGARELVTDDMLKLGIYGTPDDCIRGLETVFDAGFNHISIGGPLGRNPVEAMHLLAEHVLPAFR
jgi:5,10-methylenetetrahydromethanopterin reductase